jgi:LSD1 subclass zinc finger protein
MTSDIPCPSCRRLLRLPDAVLGQVVRCPSCQATFTAAPAEPSPSAGDPPGAPAGTSNARGEIVRDPHEQPAAPDALPRKVGREGRDEDYPVIDTRPAALSQVAGPANGLMAVGVLVLCLTGLGMCLLMLENTRGLGGAGRRGDPIPNLIGFALGFAWGGLVTAGAVRMKKLSGFGLAMTACIVAMLPCNGCCVLGLPFGIWGLVVLNRPEVKAAFR